MGKYRTGFEKKVSVNIVYELASRLWRSQTPVATGASRAVLDYCWIRFDVECGGGHLSDNDNQYIRVCPERISNQSNGIYLYFLAAVTECLADRYVAPGATRGYRTEFDRIPPGSLLVNFAYADYGYNDCAELFRAAGSDEAITLDGNFLHVNINKPEVIWFDPDP